LYRNDFAPPPPSGRLAAPMPAADTLVDWDQKHLWHPFTQMQEWVNGPEPLVIESGEGSWLVDTRGRRWLDGVASIWTNVHGHRKKELDDAVRAQLDKVAHSTLLGLGNVPAIELAKRLADVAPAGMQRVFYSDNGATAVEVALKMAFQYWRHVGNDTRTKFVRLDGSYHGDTLGAVSIGGIDLFHAAFKPLLFDTIAAPNPYPLRGRSAESCLAAMRRLFEERGKEIAALVIEPRVQGAAGILVSPPSYLKGLRALCNEHGVLLIADEVATGFGRTGPMWAVDSAGVVPDILCLAKGISGGYLPLAATLATEKVYAAFLAPYEAMRTFFHGHTYTGNPLACAVGIASLDLFEKEGVLLRNESRIAHLAERLKKVAAHPRVAEVRQSGFLVGIELGTRETEYPWAERRGVRACLGAREKGVLLRPLGNVVVLNPPLSISESEIDVLVDGALHGIEEATRG
jgi:adenosylmethionine---8-amino-7-oxononanoate aminotransferase